MVCKEWEEEDTLLTNIEVSKRAVGISINGMVECLAFTVESKEDFPDNWLPTLDLTIQENSVNYRFLKNLHQVRSACRKTPPCQETA